jgi:hypothetical protein
MEGIRHVSIAAVNVSATILNFKNVPTFCAAPAV